MDGLVSTEGLVWEDMSTEGFVWEDVCLLRVWCGWGLWSTEIELPCTPMLGQCRYNDFMNDPLAACNCTPPYSGENGISARCDLNPVNGTYPFGALGHRCHGGTDNKVCMTQIQAVLPNHGQLLPWLPTYHY